MVIPGMRARSFSVGDASQTRSLSCEEGIHQFANAENDSDGLGLSGFSNHHLICPEDLSWKWSSEDRSYCLEVFNTYSDKIEGAGLLTSNIGFFDDSRESVAHINTDVSVSAAIKLMRACQYIVGRDCGGDRDKRGFRTDFFEALGDNGSFCRNLIKVLQEQGVSAEEFDSESELDVICMHIFRCHFSELPKLSGQIETTKVPQKIGIVPYDYKGRVKLGIGVTPTEALGIIRAYRRLL